MFTKNNIQKKKETEMRRKKKVCLTIFVRKEKLCGTKKKY